MSKKLESLRAEMAKRGVDGFIVPRADEFHGEYVPASNDRLAWITGFTGSSGWAVILKDKAAFFTDGRYTLQAQAQVDAKDFEICSIDDESVGTPIRPDAWIAENLPAGSSFGVYGWIHTPRDVMNTATQGGLRPAIEKAGGKIVLLEDNPLDAAWGADRPAPPLTPAVPHPLEFSGKASEEKRGDVAAILKKKGAKALAVTMPEEICWLLNVRANDVPCTPFTLSYAIAHDDGTVDWFIDPRKVAAETRAWAGGNVRIRDFAEFPAAVKDAAQGGKIWADPATAPVKVQNIVLAAGSQLVAESSPIQLMKAKKNAVELQGMIDAHIRDGVAETRFLAAILAPGAAAKLDEMSASDLLESLRAEGKNFKGLSFDTISGAGGNGAIVHYRSAPETCKPLLAGPVYLVDSGGQYLDGTTDITRTVAVAPEKLTAEMKDRFTRVLKGHIQVAMSVFPEEETGKTLDEKARKPLKDAGLGFTHGVGHGVGSYLSVHEGPCGISSRSVTPLEPGMIVSNEPGFYKKDEYGIRIESLVAVVDTGKKDADGKRLFAFKTLTMAPIDRNLTEPALLDADELAWLNAYHAEVRATLTPLLEKTDPPAAAWLKEATEPIRKTPEPAAAPRVKGLLI